MNGPRLPYVPETPNKFDFVRVPRGGVVVEASISRSPHVCSRGCLYSRGARNVVTDHRAPTETKSHPTPRLAMVSSYSSPMPQVSFYPVLHFVSHLVTQSETIVAPDILQKHIR